jgi:hypothetical protein
MLRGRSGGRGDTGTRGGQREQFRTLPNTFSVFRVGVQTVPATFSHFQPLFRVLTGQGQVGGTFEVAKRLTQICDILDTNKSCHMHGLRVFWTMVLAGRRETLVRLRSRRSHDPLFLGWKWGWPCDLETSLFEHATSAGGRRPVGGNRRVEAVIELGSRTRGLESVGVCWEGWGRG